MVLQLYVSFPSNSHLHYSTYYISDSVDISQLRNHYKETETTVKGQKHFCRLPGKRNTLFNIVDDIWTQTNGSSIDFRRDKVSLQLF